MPKPMSKRVKLAPGQERSLTVTIKSLRNPPLDIKLSSQSLNTSILDVKTSVSERARIPTEKLKILHNKKPVADSKVLKDLAGESDSSIEFSVMVMGGAAAVQPAPQPAHGETAQGQSGKDVVGTDAFWEDLRGFLLQRVRDEKTVDEMSNVFRKAWLSSQAKP